MWGVRLCKSRLAQRQAWEQDLDEMNLGTKNRQRHNAELCREHLRSHFAAQAGLLEEFIIEIQGPEESEDVSRWDKFSDTRRIPAEMLERVGLRFEQWLNGN